MGSHAGARTVLIVEDEALIRLLMVDIVEEAGFATVEAPNADVAIVILETRSDICVIITDVDMPGSMDGLKLAHAVRGRWPPIEIIVVSGKATPSAAELPKRGVFFPKPVNPSQLVEVLQTLATQQ